MDHLLLEQQLREEMDAKISSRTALSAKQIGLKIQQIKDARATCPLCVGGYPHAWNTLPEMEAKINAVSSEKIQILIEQDALMVSVTGTSEII